MKYLLVTLCIIAAFSFVPEKKRYFYIVYVSEGGATGCFSLETINGFPSLDYMEKHGATETDGNNCVITNIIEFKEADFKQFTKPEKK